MIGSLRGVVIERNQDSTVLLEVGGVGYLIHVTPRTLGELEPTSQAFVYVHQHIREDAQTLYGFLDRDERRTFEILIATHGVGPNMAMSILATHTPRALIDIVATNDHGALTLVSGVGRKTANVVLGHAFDIPGITVDTHFGRLSRRFGWTTAQDPVKVEHEVGALIAQKEWTNLSQRMIWHGRRICHSRKPACGACPVAKLCPSYGIGEVDPVKARLLLKTDADRALNTFCL